MQRKKLLLEQFPVAIRTCNLDDARTPYVFGHADTFIGPAHGVLFLAKLFLRAAVTMHSPQSRLVAGGEM